MSEQDLAPQTAEDLRATILARYDSFSGRLQQVARHVGNRPVRGERDALRSTVAVLGDRVMGVQVERDDQCAGAVGRGQRQGLPSASAEA